MKKEKNKKRTRKTRFALRTASQAGDEPPPDDPLRRHQQEAEFDERAMAEKRLEAIKQIRKRPKSTKPPDE